MSNSIYTTEKNVCPNAMDSGQCMMEDIRDVVSGSEGV